MRGYRRQWRRMDKKTKKGEMKKITVIRGKTYQREGEKWSFLESCRFKLRENRPTESNCETNKKERK